MTKTFPKLIVRDSFGNQREVDVSRTPFTMGRQSDNDLVLLDSRISRRHARVMQDEDGYLIEDTESRHGTYVNSERVQSARLKSGDQVSLGVADSYTLTFVVEEAVLPDLLEKLEKAAESPAPQLHHLGLLLQMAQMLHRAPALEEVLSTLVDSAVQLANAERGLLFLREEQGELTLRLSRGRGGVYLGRDVSDYSKRVVARVAQTGLEEVILEEEMTGRTAQETGIIRAGVRGIVALPLQKLAMTEVTGETIAATKPEMLGVLYLDTRSHPTAVTGLDRQVLQTLAVEGATVIDNARMFRLAREQERLQHEFLLARNIQRNLLPRQLPQSDYFQLYCLTVPAQAVGGDYYDVVQLPERRYGFALADVSGKGVPAAMLAASLQGAFAAVAAGDPKLADLLKLVNDFLCERTAPEMYATIFYGVLDPQGKLEFVNAAHVPPFVVRADGSVNRLGSSNFPVGFFARTAFAVETVQLQAGDLLVICSDGVTEATDLAGEMFGETRVKDLLGSSAGQPPEEVSRRLVAAVHDYVGTAPQSDDITLTVVRFGPPQPAQAEPGP